MRPILDLNLQSWTTAPVTGLAVTPNVGSLGGVCQLGDGATAATFPTRTPNTTAGFRFNGSQWMEWGSPLASGLYTLCALLKRNDAASEYILDARTGGGVGYVSFAAGNLGYTSGTAYVDAAPTAAFPFGILALAAVSGITLSAPSLLRFGASLAWGAPLVADLFGVQLYQGALTERQLRDVKYRLMARCWTP